jgi:hypothetical protein
VVSSTGAGEIFIRYDKLTGDGPTINALVVSALTSSVPEIDPAGFGSVAALLTGAFGLIEQRRRRRSETIARSA